MGLYKRGNIWWYKKVCKGKKAEGSLDVKRRQDAEIRYAEILKRIKDGSFWQGPPEVLTMNSLIDRYLREVSPFQKSHSRNLEIAAYFKSFFGGTPVNEVTSSLLSTYKAQRLLGQLKFGRGKGRLAGPSTVKKELSFLRQVFNKAIDEWGVVGINPVKKIIKGLRDTKRTRYVTSSEAQRLAEVLPDSSIKWLQHMVIVGCCTGLREGRIVDLQLSQIDLQYGRINIPGDEMKNDEPFSIKLSLEVKAVLCRVLENRTDNNPYVFTDENGNPYTRAAVSMAFKRACRRAKVDDLRFHDLRHDFATILINNGASLYQVQHALGHKDPRMAARYAHLLPENRDVVDLVEGRGTATILLQWAQK